MILADTDVLIDFLAGQEPAASRVSAIAAADGLVTSAVNGFELLSGAREGKRGDGVRQLVSMLHVLPLDLAAAECAAEVRRNLEKSGLSIGMGDSLIAGIALANGVSIFTRNRKHLERVPGLRLE